MASVLNCILLKNENPPTICQSYHISQAGKNNSFYMVGPLANKCTLLANASIRWILVEKSSVHCRIIVYSQLKLTAEEMERFVRSLGRFSRKKGKRMKGMPKDYYLYISPNIMGNLKETKWMGFVWKNCRKWKKRDTKNEAA